VQVGIVIAISGLYTKYSEWMQFEINTAIELGKPIIGIEPLDSHHIPIAVSSHAKEMVGWDPQSIVQAIRKHYKRESRAGKSAGEPVKIFL